MYLLMDLIRYLLFILAVAAAYRGFQWVMVKLGFDA